MRESDLLKRFPYAGVKNWALTCSVAFIVVQLLWYLSSYVRGFDFLEIPMAFLYFPIAPLIDLHDGMLHNHYIYLYALAFWTSVFFLSWIISRGKISPIIPGVLILILSCLPGLIYSIYLMWRGPIIMT